MQVKPIKVLEYVIKTLDNDYIWIYAIAISKTVSCQIQTFVNKYTMAVPVYTTLAIYNIFILDVCLYILYV